MELKTHKSKKKRKLLLKMLLLFITVSAIGLLVYLSLFILTVDESLNYIITYELPHFGDINELKNLDYGSYAVAVDGEIVFSENGYEMRPTASTAKMILSLAIMRAKPFNVGESGENIEISQEFYDKYIWHYNNGGSVSRVYVGETINEYDALASTLLVSSNNMADSLAIWAFGTMDNYREYATSMLKEWGIEGVVIGDDASGLSDNTIASAEALAKIGAKVKLDPVLSEIVNLREYELPVEGKVENTNKTLGKNKVDGIKTGYIGDASGYCLVSSYEDNGHIITLALLGAPSRSDSFNDSLQILAQLQNKLKVQKIISSGDVVAFYDSWWGGKTKIIASSDMYVLGWATATKNIELKMNGQTGLLKITVGPTTYEVGVSAEEYNDKPTLFEKIKHAFGWFSDNSFEIEQNITTDNTEGDTDEELGSESATLTQITNAPSENCTIKFGTLMLINPNFTVDNDFISVRRDELVSISSLYGIVEGNPYNGDNLLDAEAGIHINDMVKDYEAEYPGHTLETRSCFRAVGTKCGRLCAATGASDHHTGLTCDLLDPAYGTSLDTNDYDQHIDWQWLKANSYKYGFIDRFPEAWAGGPMSEPLNVDENGSTGLFETWHYRYVGNPAATEIATGKYNNGQYDSLEHYLKARGLIQNLKSGTCE